MLTNAIHKMLDNNISLTINPGLKSHEIVYTDLSSDRASSTTTQFSKGHELDDEDLTEDIYGSVDYLLEQRVIKSGI